ncbi:prophage integrase [Mycobacteroides abscessus]|nr:prophage integrase [Mycobacteroides abscessus]SKF98599.1 prophage integrase [Mycobacteroides abscessus subsp. massiliense]CPW12865.1 prophage integrase [Mycobacteroides abscessus]CQA07179.1 prophage integrase [Mycobacteroides abscessus]SKG27400.1 prophage integrase [Mycobacteroides abscessus subsp. massiliense]
MRNKAIVATKLAPLTIHDLRHTYASLARKSGADLRYVQKTMGHSTPTVTANVYSDLYADELDHVATGLDQLHSAETQNAKTREDDTQTGQEPDKSNQPQSA